MSTTYDSSLATTKDQVRFLVRDTTTGAMIFQDEEIDWLVATEANVYMAAAMLCDGLSVGGSSKGLRRKKIGDLMIEYDPGQYIRLSGMLRSRGYGHQMPYAGGISASDKLAQQMDSDWVNPSVMRNLDNNPSAPQPQIPSNNPLEQV